MKTPVQLAQENPNASVAATTLAAVTVISVLADDLFGYDPSQPSFWPAVGLLVTTAVLALGSKRKKKA
jgi:hypothetical protein